MRRCGQEEQADSVGPSMDSDLVAGHVLLDEHLGTLNNARAYNEECRSEILGGEVVE